MMRAVSRFRVWLLVGAALVWLTPAKLAAQALPANSAVTRGTVDRRAPRARGDLRA